MNATPVEAATAPGRLVNVRLESTDTTPHRLLGWVLLAVALAGLTAEASLGVRAWSQISGELPAGLAGMAYRLSETLTTPFRSFETSAPIRTTSILEIGTYVAIVVYLAATLAALSLLTMARYVLSHLAARRPQTIWLPVPAPAHSTATTTTRQPAFVPAPAIAIPLLGETTSPSAAGREPLAKEGLPTSVAV